MLDKDEHTCVNTEREEDKKAPKIHEALNIQEAPNALNIHGT